MAIGSGSLSDETLAIVTNVHQAHVSYGQSLNGAARPQRPERGVVRCSPTRPPTRSAATRRRFLAAAYELEETLVATHTRLIGQLLGTNGVELISSILIVEARHSLVFADLPGETDLETLIFTTAEALEPGEG